MNKWGIFHQKQATRTIYTQSNSRSMEIRLRVCWGILHARTCSLARPLLKKREMPKAEQLDAAAVVKESRSNASGYFQRT
jgi:hypothetical protein